MQARYISLSTEKMKMVVPMMMMMALNVYCDLAHTRLIVLLHCLMLNPHLRTA
uniref:Uncharacterized protein n=1 Tax=Anguilla anguilla TaxID=7936 RepID=A0A0E9TUT0_ANGAN